MSLPSSIVDVGFRPRIHAVDQRALMAFAAGVGDARPELIDTARPGGIVPHPLFPVAVEWRSYLDVMHELVARGLDRDMIVMAAPVHYDLRWHGTIKPGDQLVTKIRVSCVEAVADGVILSMQVDTEHDHAEGEGEGEGPGDAEHEEPAPGGLVTRSLARVLFPECRLDGPGSTTAVGDPPVIDLRAEWSNPDAVIRRGHRRVGAAAAHVFSECADMWNPAYTDKAVALQHGRAFLAMPPAGALAMAVGGALQLGGTDPAWVRRVQADFGALVPVPSSLEIEAEVPTRPSSTAPIRFRAHLEDGTPVINAGVLVTDPADVDLEAVRLRARAERRRAVGARPRR